MEAGHHIVVAGFHAEMRTVSGDNSEHTEDAKGEFMSRRPVLMKVEIPFCFHACEFCSRSVIPGWDSRRMRSYARAVVNEIVANASQFDDCEVRAVHFGGGTASNVGQDAVTIAQAIRKHYHLAADAPFTMRASIANISGATMPLFKRAGIQRYDLEMLSLYQVNFSQFNQTDCFNDFPIICDNFLRSYANDSLGLVLLYGHKDLPTLDFRRSCLASAATHASHIALQCAASGTMASEEICAEQRAQAREVFGAEGFVEYLPLRFARPGKEDRYLIGREAGGETLSFGLGAQTCIEGARSTNTSDLEVYLAGSDDFSKITVAVEPIDASAS
jgi:coproporphyrinogen III oxidase-like Fe-S oxidoreductase